MGIVHIKKILIVTACVTALAGCKRYTPMEDVTEASVATEVESSEGVAESDTAAETVASPIVISTEPELPERTPVRVKGIYVSAYVAGSGTMLDEIVQHIDETEVNAVVIDVKDDSGRVTFAMDDAPTVQEIGASKVYIDDVDAMVQKLKEHNIYVIARVVAFRDPYMAEAKPEWSLHLADGSLFRDRSGLAWVNPYKQEVWDYLIEVGTEAGKAGFDEIQFDYIRFCTEKGMKDVVFDEADTKGRSKTDVISEFVEYAHEKLMAEGLYMAADVFGAIIGSEEDSASVGQIYGEMAKNLDYICPMIYPSHYGDGNFGVQYPDTEPYKIILAALQGSELELSQYRNSEETGEESGQPAAGTQLGESEQMDENNAQQAIVRPWLQDFTAKYLKHYIPYRAKEVRDEIQGVYDAGYDEWILWSASCKYTWDAMKTPEEAEQEDAVIAENREAAKQRALEEAAVMKASKEARDEASRAAEEESKAAETANTESDANIETTANSDETAAKETLQ